MKFAMFSDLHYDAIPDGDKRIEEFLTYVQKAEAEFIVDLGDLCYPLHENNKLLDKLKSSGLPCYFTIGNHNTDKFTIEEVIKFFGLKKSYYSFIRDNIKFIVLDSNFIKKENAPVPYYNRNYSKTTDDYPYVPNEEIKWLKEELKDNDKYYIIISHQSLTNDFQKRGISNREEIRSILEERNLKERKILFCINGHDHGGDYKVVNDIYYYTLNSMSYIWHGIKEVFNYSDEIHKQYPSLKYLILYKEALHIIVDIDKDMNVSIKGMDGNYQKHSPKDIGIGTIWNGVSIDAKAPSVYIMKKKKGNSVF